MTMLKRINICFILIVLALFFAYEKIEADGASLYISPPSESFFVGETFFVEINMDGGGNSVNAVQATIYFPADKLEVLNIIKNNSVCTLWPKEPLFSNLIGKISFAGGLPHPGVKDKENIIIIQFRAKEKGTANFVFDNARILASDGKGTDTLVYLKTAKYAILKESDLIQSETVLPRILSSRHLNENEWYNNAFPKFKWDAPPEVSGFSFAFNKNPETIPDTVSEGMVQEKDYGEVEDGVWYFHLRAEDENGWGETVHHKIQIDTLPPDTFELVVDNLGDPTNPKPNLYFETDDNLSGLSHYKIKIGDDRFSELMLAQVNPFPLPSQEPGVHPLIVRAVDNAGNNVESETIIEIEPIETPNISLWPNIYVAGEEIFYIEGQAPPETEVIIFLKKDGKETNKWQTTANNQGEWSFSTEELIKSGTYYLSVQAQDARGAKSLVSDSKKIEVSLSGLYLWAFAVSFKVLAIFLLSALLLSIIAVVFFVVRTSKSKKTLQKETDDIKEKVFQVFKALREETEEQIKGFDSKPGFSEKEKKIYDDIMVALDVSEELIRKEIRDVEKELE